MEFADGEVSTPAPNQFSLHNGILGINRSLQSQFDRTKVDAIEVSEETINSLDTVYMYDGVKRNNSRVCDVSFPPKT